MWVLVDKGYFAKQVGSMIVVGEWKLLYIREKRIEQYILLNWRKGNNAIVVARLDIGRRSTQNMMFQKMKIRRML
jgi:hypothetical protein